MEHKSMKTKTYTYVKPLIHIYIYLSNCYRNLEKQTASCRAGFPVEAAARIAKRVNRAAAFRSTEARMGPT